MKRTVILFIFSVVSLAGISQELIVRIADVGAGLATVSRLPDGKVIVYDAGNYSRFLPALREMAPEKEIELLILSHNDSDHIRGLEAIAAEFEIKKLIYSPFRGETCTTGSGSVYCKTMRTIRTLEAKGTLVVSVTNSFPAPGSILYNNNGIKLTYLCGFDDPYALWGNLPISKARNAISIVVKMEYGDHSILFGGDAVGKLEDSENCVMTEQFMLENLSAEILKSTILISPHHGADNGACENFIRVVSPEFVIFSAGHDYEHPRATTALRFLHNGVEVNKIFRTDRGDDEDDLLEWNEGEIDGCKDDWGDDDIYLNLRSGEKPVVGYLYPYKSECR